MIDTTLIKCEKILADYYDGMIAEDVIHSVISSYYLLNSSGSVPPLNQFFLVADRKQYLSQISMSSGVTEDVCDDVLKNYLQNIESGICSEPSDNSVILWLTAIGAVAAGGLFLFYALKPAQFKKMKTKLLKPKKRSRR